MSHMNRVSRVGHELSALLALATPIIIAQVAHTAMGAVDAVMAGRVSAADLAAVALGNSVWIPLYLLMTGILMATTPKVPIASAPASWQKSGRWCARRSGWDWRLACCSHFY